MVQYRTRNTYKITGKLEELKAPTNKTQVRHLRGLFGYWRQHISCVKVTLQPLYSITRKANDFIWDKPQEQAVKTVLKYIKEYSKLYNIRADDTVYLDIQETGISLPKEMLENGSRLLL